MLSRRFIVSSPLLLASAAGRAIAAAGKPQLALNTGVSVRLLKLAQQLGLEWVDLGARPLGLIPPPGQPPRGTATAFTTASLGELNKQVAAHGLKIGIMPLHPVPNALLGNKDRDHDIKAVHQSIRAAARMGIPVLEYNWMLLRPSAGYFETEGRGGSKLRAFDYARIRADAAQAELAGVTVDEIWRRLEYFLKAVVPVAEREGVRLALHPNDPPVASFRGVPQAIRTGEDLKRVIGIVDSPANGITFDTGVMREGGGDVISLIRYFGSRDRINHVHFRNVRLHEPFTRYTETFLDDGDIDMRAAMRAFVETGYSRCLVPDHSPRFDNDSEDHLAGWAYTIAYLKALLQ